MRKFSFLFVALLAAVMAFGITGTAAAQGGTVENYTFPATAEWLQTPYFARVGGAVNARSIPTDVNNTARFTFASGSTVKVSATVDVGAFNWLLVRGWDTTGYLGSGWIREDVARLTRVDSLDTPTPPACSLTDRGEPLAVDIRFNDGWVHDALSTGCTLFYEGRIDETEYHHYFVARDSNQNATATITNDGLLTDGWMWLLEGGAWIHPTTWAIGRGMSNGDTGQSLKYPPMISFFAADKQAVMAKEGYRWPFVVTLVNGTELDFAYGAFGAQSNTVDRCDLTEPRSMSITGIYVPATKSFRSASVGAEGCLTVIFWQLPNGDYQLVGLQGTDENLEYKFIYATYLMPSSYDDAQISAYALDEIIANAHIASGTKIKVTGIAGLSDFTR